MDQVYAVDLRSRFFAITFFSPGTMFGFSFLFFLLSVWMKPMMILSDLELPAEFCFDVKF